jgi:hypothetical protein
MQLGHRSNDSWVKDMLAKLDAMKSGIGTSLAS